MSNKNAVLLKYPLPIMKSVRQNLGRDRDDPSLDAVIEGMSRMEVFGRVLTWEGIIGYEDLIASWIQDIFEIDLEEVK